MYLIAFLNSEKFCIPQLICIKESGPALPGKQGLGRGGSTGDGERHSCLKQNWKVRLTAFPYRLNVGIKRIIYKDSEFFGLSNW